MGRARNAVVLLAAFLAIVPSGTQAVVPFWTLDNSTTVILNDLTGSGYDASSRPLFGTGRPTVVSVQFQLRSLFDLDPLSSTFVIDCDMRLSWFDPRLIFSREDYPVPAGRDVRLLGHAGIGEGHGAPYQIWTPDVYFENEVEPILQNEVVKIVPETGEVTFRRHFLARLTANFEFQSFPFDSQWLPVMLTPYSFNTDQLQIYFQADPVFPEPNNTNFAHAAWEYVAFKTERVIFQSRAGQPFYDRLILSIQVDRRSDSYIIKTVLPLILLVSLSCISYWFSVEAVPERLGLVVTLVLTIVSFYSTVTASLPPVNYPTTLDYYVTMAFFISFIGLVEVSAVHHLVVRRNDILLATEIDYFHRRTVLPVWGVFNLILVKTGIWLGVLVAILIFVIILWNAWILYYRVAKRRQTRFAPMDSMMAGASQSAQRRGYDTQLNGAIQATDAVYNFLRLQIPVSDEQTALKAIAAVSEAETKALEDLMMAAESNMDLKEESKAVLTNTLGRGSLKPIAGRNSIISSLAAPMDSIAVPSVAEKGAVVNGSEKTMSG